MTYCGVLNIDKPAGMTSRAVVDEVLNRVRPAKVGHAGTLDPLATGVLVVCVGHATRLISLIQDGRKGYDGQFRLGVRSNTDDITGIVTPGEDYSHVTRGDVLERLADLTGRIEQVPPAFSAVHVEGQRAYKLARKGQVVELKPKPVEVYSAELTQFVPPELRLTIECGSGTYLRSIGRDLGEMLGCGALMTDLRRTSVGSFHVDTAVTVEMLKSKSIEEFLQPALSAVANHDRRHLIVEECVAIRQGRSIPTREIEQSESTDNQSSDSNRLVALLGPDGLLVGMAELDQEQALLNPRIVFPQS